MGQALLNYNAPLTEAERLPPNQAKKRKSAEMSRRRKKSAAAGDRNGKYVENLYR